MGKSAGSVPETDDFKASIDIVHPVDDSKGTENNLAQFQVPEFWHHAASFREGTKRQSRVEQLVAQPSGSDGILGRNVSNNPLQIVYCVVGEEYLEIHWGMR